MKTYLIFHRRGKPIGSIPWSEQQERAAVRRLLLRQVRRGKGSVTYEVLGIKQEETQP